MRLSLHRLRTNRSSNGSALGCLISGVASSDLSVFDGVFGRLRGTTETAELLAQLEMEADPEAVARVRQVAEGIDTNEAHEY